MWAFFEANPRTAGPTVQITFDPIALDDRDVTISGAATGDREVAQVVVRLENAADQFAWSTRFEDLPDDRRYRPVAEVALADGSRRTAVGPLFTVGDPTISVTTTFNEHILDGRIVLQAPPCVPGFGVCDADFNSLFFQFGLDPFPLHAADASGSGARASSVSSSDDGGWQGPYVRPGGRGPPG